MDDNFRDLVFVCAHIRSSWPLQQGNFKDTFIFTVEQQQN